MFSDSPHVSTRSTVLCLKEDFHPFGESKFCKCGNLFGVSVWNCVTELTALLILGDLQVTSVKFVAKDEYALTGSVDKVCTMFPYTASSFYCGSPVYDWEFYYLVCWNLADSQNLARTGRWQLRLQAHLERSFSRGILVRFYLPKRPFILNSLFGGCCSLHDSSEHRMLELRPSN